MNLSTQPYKGARDFYPNDKRLQNFMFYGLSMVAERFGYVQYDAPILEPMELYLSKSSEEIVAEQTYSFTDRGGRNVVIRPEMTPTVSRMVAAKRQELNYPLRWYSIPNVWRYERPQAGRLREHWQLNVDIFGVPGIEAEHEIIQVADTVFGSFGASRDMYEIRLNSRQLINEILNDFTDKNADQVLAVIRLVDHKAKMPHADFLTALAKLVPDNKHHELDEILKIKSFDELPEKYAKHPSVKQLKQLKALLAQNNIDNVVDDLSLMRGFDYYTDIVFEVFDKHPDNNRSLAGGGRYDGLVGLFGVDPVPTVGFAVGDVTLQRFLEIHELMPELETETDVEVILIGDVYKDAQDFVFSLREKGINVSVDMLGRKLDTSIKHAVKSGVGIVIFIGEEELKSKTAKAKDLKSGKEFSFAFDDIDNQLELWFGQDNA